MANPPIAPKFLNTAEAADFLGCTEYTLRAKRSRGGRGTKRRPGPPWHDTDGGIRYRLDELEAYLGSRRRVVHRPVPERSAAT